MTFLGTLIKRILNANRNCFTNASIELSVSGIAKIYFEEETSSAEYWLGRVYDYADAEDDLRRQLDFESNVEQ